MACAVGVTTISFKLTCAGRLTANQIISLITDLKGQASVIEAVVRSLVDLSNVVYTNYATDQNIIDIRTELEQNLEKMKITSPPEKK